MKKVWHHYLKWEDYQNGMYRNISGDERSQFLVKAIEFTGDAELYGLYMQDVIIKWPIACEQNLTDQGMNRRAWVGHAACCLAIGCPEDITRQAWGSLTTEQQDLANHQADLAIETWGKRYESEDRKVS